MRCSTIYDCNNCLFTYFCQCVVYYHHASGITPTESSFHPSFTHLLMITMTINVLYLPPHLLHSLSCDPLLSFCGVICSAGSRRLDSELHRPTHVPVGFTCYADLKASLFPPLQFSHFLLHVQRILGSPNGTFSFHV